MPVGRAFKRHVLKHGWEDVVPTSSTVGLSVDLVGVNLVILHVG